VVAPPRGPWQRNSFGRCLTTCNPDSRSPATNEADRYGQRRSGLHALLGQRTVTLPPVPLLPLALRCLFGPYTSKQTKKNMNLFFPELVMWGGGALGPVGAHNFSVRQNATILNDLPSDVLQKHENRSAASQVHAHVSVCGALCHSFAVQLVVLSFPLCYLSSGVWP